MHCHRYEWSGDANGQAMRIARRWEWSGDANGHANPHERIACESLCDPATHLHAQFSNQQTHGQMNNKTGGRFCSHKSRGPLSASSCDKEWGRGAKPPKNFWGPAAAAAAAAAHLDPHLLMNTNMPRRDFTCLYNRSINCCHRDRVQSGPASRSPSHPQRGPGSSI